MHALRGDDHVDPPDDRASETVRRRGRGNVRLRAWPAHDELSVVYSLSDEEWAGPTGHTQGHLDDLDKDFYVCGVPGMVVDTKGELDELGVDDDRVFSEGWEDGEVED